MTPSLLYEPKPNFCQLLYYIIPGDGFHCAHPLFFAYAF